MENVTFGQYLKTLYESPDERHLLKQVINERADQLEISLQEQD